MDQSQNWVEESPGAGIDIKPQERVGFGGLGTALYGEVNRAGFGLYLEGILETHYWHHYSFNNLVKSTSSGLPLCGYSIILGKV